MRKTIKTLTASLVIFTFVLTSCSLPGVKATPAIPDTGGSNGGNAGIPANPEVIQSTANTPAELLPLLTEAPAMPAQDGAIAHVDVPGDPSFNPNQVATDCDTSDHLKPGTDQVNSSKCDNWARENLERPVTSANGTYVPALDILWIQAGNSGPWIFLKIHFNNLGNPPAGLRAGFELDPNLDSRGDILLLATLPSTNEWTTDGVQVWQDTNQDNGGEKPFTYDLNKGDGYETNLFDSGKGNDPDLAWVRISPKNPDTLEFALKAGVLSNPEVFGWWAWSDLGGLNASQFEPVDRVQADTTWTIDNTCSWIYGITPKSGQLVNLCKVAEPEPTATPIPATGSNVPPPANCVVTKCSLGFYFDNASCSCKHFIIIFLPTSTPIIIY